MLKGDLLNRLFYRLRYSDDRKSITTEIVLFLAAASLPVIDYSLGQLSLNRNWMDQKITG